MPTLAIGLALLVLVLWGLKSATRLDPAKLARALKAAGGIAALAVAAMLAVRGSLALAAPLGVAGLVLLNLWPGIPANMGSRTRQSPGQ
ncbi:molecular chaperone DnaJ, partial [bacterium]|nr:molecular chaperone DnaJ [bacterium]